MARCDNIKVSFSLDDVKLLYKILLSRSAFLVDQINQEYTCTDVREREEVEQVLAMYCAEARQIDDLLLRLDPYTL